jgi:phosphoribosylformylglycinamidine synthase
MIFFFKKTDGLVVAVESSKNLDSEQLNKLAWLVNGEHINSDSIQGIFRGPRREMISPWSTNAVEITQNMDIDGILRMEEFTPLNDTKFDPMLKAEFNNLDQNTFNIDTQPQKILHIDNIEEYNKQEGLALNELEVEYLNNLSKKMDRPLTDSEVFGFSQVNSEHCRHKIFNGQFIIDGEEKEASLFSLIKKTTKQNPGETISAYKDNVAFIDGPEVEQFSPVKKDESSYFETQPLSSILSLKAETHNFPTTVEPFNGAATGSGGEIRDRLAGGKASSPLAGTAVYMTPYSRGGIETPWEKASPARQWLYQTPSDILIKASNGASDFGNKFGQPLICGSLLTYEHKDEKVHYGFDKVIMLAGGIGFGAKKDALKATPEKGDRIVVLGGDNYRIGMGGGAVSSVETGSFDNKIELNAVQRSNPEMQKRTANAIRALSELSDNPIISIHDHGAGGHLNCLSELVEETGGSIDIKKLPVGDSTLSAKEIVGNESQERMGLVIKEKDIPLLEKIAARERCPMYVVGTITENQRFTFTGSDEGINPIDLALEDMFGGPPQTIMKDNTETKNYADLKYDSENFEEKLKAVLQLEAVGSKDWLTNKVDRSVTGKVALQQTAGTIQLPVNNLGIMALDYRGAKGVGTALGHAPGIALINAAAGSRIAIARSLTNIVWASLEKGLKGISLSANWMWPCRVPGEDSRLYDAVSATSEFAIDLEINIPTGKDSLSMVQKYSDGEKVVSPGTVIITSAAQIKDIKKTVTPALQNQIGSKLIYIDLCPGEFNLGGSSFSQTIAQLGNNCPDIKDSKYFVKCFNKIQSLIASDQIIAGHDIAAGGLITSLLEMNFTNNQTGIDIDISVFDQISITEVFFCEKPGYILQVDAESNLEDNLKSEGISAHTIATVNAERKFTIKHNHQITELNLDSLRDLWMSPSHNLDKLQCENDTANERYKNYKNQELEWEFPNSTPSSVDTNSNKVKAAIIREKGVNGDREMAWSMFAAGFNVKDVHMTDLISGRENLEDIQFIVFVGGFSNSDVLGSAKGWAGAFLYNEKAKHALDNFYNRPNTMSLGVCNGCQLMVELQLINRNKNSSPVMNHNNSGKFESSFLTVSIPQSPSIMLDKLSDSKLGIWVAHGEGRFSLPDDFSDNNIALKYAYSAYPGNPNGSDRDCAGIVSDDGRHLAMMPHLERAIYPWQCANYPVDKKNEENTPWIEAFKNAYNWLSN